MRNKLFGNNWAVIVQKYSKRNAKFEYYRTNILSSFIQIKNYKTRTREKLSGNFSQCSYNGIPKTYAKLENAGQTFFTFYVLFQGPKLN